MEIKDSNIVTRVNHYDISTTRCRLWMTFVLLCLLAPVCAQTTTVSLLETKENGPWPCVYYFLNSNEELEGLDPKAWAGHCVDESDWIYGYGPLSNSYDQFRFTVWASEVHPLLVRRHFTLSSDNMSALSQGQVTLTCSYDENPHFYLNGKSLWSLSGWNDNDYATRPFTSRHKTLLREGDNVLAVSLSKGAGGGHIDFGLTLTYSDNPDAVDVIQIDDDADGRVYNLCGMQLQHPTSPGLYIKDRKTILLVP